MPATPSTAGRSASTAQCLCCACLSDSNAGEGQLAIPAAHPPGPRVADGLDGGRDAGLAASMASMVRNV